MWIRSKRKEQMIDSNSSHSHGSQLFLGKVCFFYNNFRFYAPKIIYLYGKNEKETEIASEIEEFKNLKSPLIRTNLFEEKP